MNDKSEREITFMYRKSSIILTASILTVLFFCAVGVGQYFAKDVLLNNGDKVRAVRCEVLKTYVRNSMYRPGGYLSFTGRKIKSFASLVWHKPIGVAVYGDGADEYKGVITKLFSRMYLYSKLKSYGTQRDPSIVVLVGKDILNRLRNKTFIVQGPLGGMIEKNLNNIPTKEQHCAGLTYFAKRLGIRVAVILANSSKREIATKCLKKQIYSTYGLPRTPPPPDGISISEARLKEIAIKVLYEVAKGKQQVTYGEFIKYLDKNNALQQCTTGMRK